MDLNLPRLALQLVSNRSHRNYEVQIIDRGWKRIHKPKVEAAGALIATMDEQGGRFPYLR